MELELRDRLSRLRLGNAVESALVGLIILVVLVLFSPANTPILPRDEGVFVYIGRGILEGKLPYRDLWDHKGPLIYYIDAFGLWIGQGSLWGVWLIEALLLSLSLVLLYRLLRAGLSREAGLFGLLTWVVGFAIVLGGNIVEEYSIPLTVLALYLALRRPRWPGLWLGLLAGLECMLRPNEIAGPVVALFFVLADRVHSGGWTAIARGVLSFTGGFLLVAGGFAAYFEANHAFDDFLSSVFFFNFYYASRGGQPLAGLPAGLVTWPFRSSSPSLACSAPCLQGGRLCALIRSGFSTSRWRCCSSPFRSPCFQDESTGTTTFPGCCR